MFTPTPVPETPKSQEENTLVFTPPGFKQELRIKFPDSRLAVCEKCKKNYKTRDMCRGRNKHTAPPWSTAYLCITMDESSIDPTTNKLVERPLAVNICNWQPFCAIKDFDAKTPVCSTCKKTNRTRSFCRHRHKHKQLPWCAVYACLSAAPSEPAPADPQNPINVNVVSNNVDNAVVKTDDTLQNNVENVESKSNGETPVVQEDQLSKTENEFKSESETLLNAEQVNETETATNCEKDVKAAGAKNSDSEEPDSIDNIHESRTFLIEVSSTHCSLQWLERADQDILTNNFGQIVQDNMTGTIQTTATTPMMTVAPHQQLFTVSNTIPAQVFPATTTAVASFVPANSPEALKITQLQQQQQFFQMQQQQQQQFFANQAAWHAQYTQQMRMASTPMIAIQSGTTPNNTNTTTTSNNETGAPTASTENVSTETNKTNTVTTDTDKGVVTLKDKTESDTTQQQGQQQQQAQVQAQTQWLYQQQFYPQQMGMGMGMQQSVVVPAAPTGMISQPVVSSTAPPPLAAVQQFQPMQMYSPQMFTMKPQQPTPIQPHPLPAPTNTDESNKGSSTTEPIPVTAPEIQPLPVLQTEETKTDSKSISNNNVEKRKISEVPASGQSEEKDSKKVKV